MRLDILVDRKVIIEVKTTETVLAVHKEQVLTYLRLTNLKLGLLINFGQGCLIDGWSRVVNDLLCPLRLSDSLSLRYIRLNSKLVKELNFYLVVIDSSNEVET